MINNYINAYQDEIAVSFVVITYIIVLFFQLPIVREKHQSIIKKMMVIAYIFAVLYKTLLMRNKGDYIMNLNFFWSYKASINGDKGLANEIFLNIMLYIPLGCFQMCAIKRKSGVLKTLLTGIMLSTFVEIMQYIWQVGMFELDDILSNTIGTIIGIAGVLLIEKLLK